MGEGRFLKRREIEHCGLKEEKRIIELRRLDGMGDGGRHRGGNRRRMKLELSRQIHKETYYQRRFLKCIHLHI